MDIDQDQVRVKSSDGSEHEPVFEPSPDNSRDFVWWEETKPPFTLPPRGRDWAMVGGQGIMSSHG